MSSSSGSQGRRPEEDSGEFAYRSDIDTSIDFDDAAGIATFPSGMRYSIHDLEPGTKDAIVRALGTPSKLALRGCSSRGQGYVFLISETIDYHVRAPFSSSPYDGPSCSCRHDEKSVGRQYPCRHTLWLCDQILSQLVPLHSDPYTWREDGYTTKHGNVCDYVPDFELDVLADSLRCDIMAGEDSSMPRPRRIRLAREVLTTLCGRPVDQYRPDLTGEIAGGRVVREGDLEGTIFRMLLQNDSFLSYCLSSMRNHEPLNPKFRRFRDRADAALDAFDNYIKASDSVRFNMSKNPQWCYKTFKDILEQIKSIIIYSDRELDDFDRRAAANTLVYILDQVVNRNEDHELVRSGADEGARSGDQLKNSRKINLFMELVVESSHDFVLDILDELESEFVDHLLPDLSRIERTLTNTNAPKSFCKKLRDIISRLRGASSRVESEPAEGSRKRTSQDSDRPPKRVK
ncbi:hypothetical protein F5Y01DRAFT_301040 [Xylaria sp. FL0043]|nr:hypothetical protein F5Y01DRAFT_301040 [Xylaria sp. FL0043]